MKTLTFEKRNREVTKVKATIEYIAKTANTKEQAVNRLSDILSLKIGFGANHVWCANEKNQRVFIVTGF